MELEEIQATWSQLSNQLKHQKKLTNTLIMQMTEQRYRNKIAMLSKYEGLGTLVCFAAALLLLFQFQKLDTWYLKASGMFTVGYLVVFPIIVLRSINAMKRIDLISGTNAETLIAYTKKRVRFLFIQRVGIYLNFALLAVSLPVMVKVFKGKNIFVSDSNILYWYVPIMSIFLVIFSSWGYGKYKKVTASASDVLRELEDAED